jgi:hypothetical protein
MHARSAADFTQIAGYAPHLPHVGTSPAVADWRTAVRSSGAPIRECAVSAYQQVLTMSVADQARELLAALALNKSHLAQVLRVTRPTLYDWLDGKGLNRANAERMAGLMRLLKRTGISSTTPLNARFVRQPTAERSASLLEELSSEQWKEGRIEKLLRAAQALSEELENRRRAREDRLRGLGYQDPSDDDRRKLLNQNVAMLEWPKK